MVWISNLHVVVNFGGSVHVMMLTDKTKDGLLSRMNRSQFDIDKLLSICHQVEANWMWNMKDSYKEDHN